MGDDRPFVCNAPGCGQRFTNEDHLAVHKHKHEMTLKFGPARTDSVIIADQTPTPTRFLKNCEEVGLFNELAGSFEHDFKRAAEDDDKKSAGALDMSLPSTPDVKIKEEEPVEVDSSPPDSPASRPPSPHNRDKEIVPKPVIISTPTPTIVRPGSLPLHLGYDPLHPTLPSPTSVITQAPPRQQTAGVSHRFPPACGAARERTDHARPPRPSRTDAFCYIAGAAHAHGAQHSRHPRTTHQHQRLHFTVGTPGSLRSQNEAEGQLDGIFLAQRQQPGGGFSQHAGAGAAGAEPDPRPAPRCPFPGSTPGFPRPTHPQHRRETETHGRRGPGRASAAVPGAQPRSRFALPPEAQALGVLLGEESGGAHDAEHPAEQRSDATEERSRSAQAAPAGAQGLSGHCATEEDTGLSREPEGERGAHGLPGARHPAQLGPQRAQRPLGRRSRRHLGAGADGHAKDRTGAAGAGTGPGHHGPTVPIRR
ncbi:Atf7 [Columba livia]|nr:Atf7 [Columba livia]KAK2512839.1 Atf7 [Columba livia]